MRTGSLFRAATAIAAAAFVAACGGPAGPGTPAASPGSRTPSPSASAPARTPGPAAPSSAPSAVPSPGGPAAPRPGGTSPAPGGVAARLAGRDWTVIPTASRVVALTFDAGGSDAGLASILGTLHRTGVPATFFLTGSFARSYPAGARQIAAGGYLIGDHTATHPHLTQLSDAAVRAEILAGASQIRAVTGAGPAPLLRFPYGESDQRTIAVANRAGYVAVRWTVDTLGWEGKAGGISAGVVVSRVLAAAQPGEIVLMHVGANPDDGTTFDADALAQVVSQLRARGYSFVTLAALTG